MQNRQKVEPVKKLIAFAQIYKYNSDSVYVWFAVFVRLYISIFVYFQSVFLYPSRSLFLLFALLLWGRESYFYRRNLLRTNIRWWSQPQTRIYLRKRAKNCEQNCKHTLASKYRKTCLWYRRRCQAGDWSSLD